MAKTTDKSDDVPEVASHDQLPDLTVIVCHGVYGELEDHPPGPGGRRCGCRGGFVGNPGGKCGRRYAVVDAGPDATMICGHTEEYHYSIF